MYDYYWQYTSAQIDLMNVDAPFIAYKKREKKDGETSGEPTRESCEEAVRRWEERKKTRKFKLEDFLKQIPNSKEGEDGNENTGEEQPKENKTDITE